MLFGLVLLLFFISTVQTVKQHSGSNTPKKKSDSSPNTLISNASLTPTITPAITLPLLKSITKPRTTPHSLGLPTATPFPPKKTVTGTITPSVTGGPTLAPIKAQVKLMPLGDSITYGSVVSGGYRTGLWQWVVQGDGFNIDFVGSQVSGYAGDLDNEGHVGWTIAQLDVYAFNWMRLYQPDIVLLHIGTNDLLQGNSAGAMTQSLTKLVGDIYSGKPDTYIVLSSLIPTSQGDQGAWSAYNASIPGVVASYQGQGRKIMYVDMSQSMTQADLVDGIHPNTIGNSKMVSVWYPAVASIYRSQTGRR